MTEPKKENQKSNAGKKGKAKKKATASAKPKKNKAKTAAKKGGDASPSGRLVDGNAVAMFTEWASMHMRKDVESIVKSGAVLASIECATILSRNWETIYSAVKRAKGKVVTVPLTVSVNEGTIKVAFKVNLDRVDDTISGFIPNDAQGELELIEGN